MDRCRLCLSEQNLIDLFHECVVELEQLRKFVHDASGVEVKPTDNITKKVCRRCCSVSVKVFKFRSTAIANDKWLKEQQQRFSNDLNNFVIKEEQVDLEELEELNLTTEDNVVTIQQSTTSVPLSTETNKKENVTIEPSENAQINCLQQINRNQTINRPHTSSYYWYQQNAREQLLNQQNEKHKTYGNIKISSTIQEQVTKKQFIEKPAEESSCNLKKQISPDKTLQISDVRSCDVNESTVNTTPNTCNVINNSHSPVKKKIYVARKSTVPSRQFIDSYIRPSTSAVNKDEREEKVPFTDSVPASTDKSLNLQEKSSDINDLEMSGNNTYRKDLVVSESLLLQLLQGVKCASSPKDPPENEVKSHVLEKQKRLRLSTLDEERKQILARIARGEFFDQKPNEYGCRYCGMKFAQKTQWYKHEYRHPKCLYCRKKFKSATSRNNHLKHCKQFNKFVGKVCLVKVDTIQEIREQYPAAFNHFDDEEQYDSGVHIDMLIPKIELTESGEFPVTKKSSHKPKKKSQVKRKKKATTTSKIKNCCPYCKTCVSHFTRHLQRAHFDESEVSKFMVLPLFSADRTQIVAKLRVKGIAMYKSDPGIRKNILPKKSSTLLAERNDFLPCPACDGYFTKYILCEHYKTCGGTSETPDVLQKLAQGVSERFLNETNEMIQNVVLPSLKKTPYYSIIKFDRFLLQYGAELSMRYHNDDGGYLETVTLHLRHLGQFFREVKFMNPLVPNISAIFNPEMFPVVIKAIKRMKCYSPEFKCSFGVTLRECAEMLLNKSIKLGKRNFQRIIEQYLEKHLGCYSDDNSWITKKN